MRVPEQGMLASLAFEHPMPKEVRKFGRVIDPTILQAGDLIFVSSYKPDYLSRQIAQYQAKLFEPEHARWEHVAISAGRFEICEAVSGGVQAVEYWRYMTGRHDIKVKRLRAADEATRARLAYYAATNVRTKYGYLTALNLGIALRNGNLWGTLPPRRTRGVICSQLYFEACMREGYLLASIPPEAACPAHLSMSPQLEDIPLQWVAI